MESTYKCQYGTYTIKKTRFGLYQSYMEDGTPMLIGLTEDGVRYVTEEIHLPVLVGEFDGYTSVTRSGTVGGKL